MDELEISGKRFISSKRAGKEHKYHPDYIGQLIRAGKVPGQKVGRSWYVDEAALVAYFSGDVDFPLSTKEMSANEELVNNAVVITTEEAPSVVNQSRLVEEVTVRHATESIDEAETEIIADIPTEEERPVVLHLKDDVKEEKNNRLESVKGLTYFVDDADTFPSIVRTRTKTQTYPKSEEQKEVQTESHKKRMPIFVFVLASILVLVSATVLSSSTINVVTVVNGAASSAISFENMFSASF